MSSFRINIPIEISVDVEVDTAEVMRRIALLLNNGWQGGSLHPTALDFHDSTRLFLCEAVGTAVSACSFRSGSTTHYDYDSAKELVKNLSIKFLGEESAKARSEPT